MLVLTMQAKFFGCFSLVILLISNRQNVYNNLNTHTQKAELEGLELTNERLPSECSANFQNKVDEECLKNQTKHIYFKISMVNGLNPGVSVVCPV